jgi:F-type H+-transporting ATPase subunit b
MFRPILATVENIHEAAHTAAGHAAVHGAEAAHHMSFAQYIFHSNVINMVFVAAFIIWVSKKADLFGMLKARQEQVLQTITKAEEAKAEAEKILKEAKESTKGLNSQVAQIMGEAKVSAASMSEKIQQDTEQKLEEIHKNLQKTIDVEEKAAADEILQSISKEAFELASGKIKNALNDEMHHRYISNFIDSIDEVKVK